MLPENLLKFYLHFSAPMSRERFIAECIGGSTGKTNRVSILELARNSGLPMATADVILRSGRINEV